MVAEDCHWKILQSSIFLFQNTFSLCPLTFLFVINKNVQLELFHIIYFEFCFEQNITNDKTFLFFPRILKLPNPLSYTETTKTSFPTSAVGAILGQGQWSRTTNLPPVFYQFVFSVALVSRYFQLVCRTGTLKDPKTFDLFTEASSL